MVDPTARVHPNPNFPLFGLHVPGSRCQSSHVTSRERGEKCSQENDGREPYIWHIRNLEFLQPHPLTDCYSLPDAI